jgi:hypothetical protein
VLLMIALSMTAAFIAANGKRKRHMASVKLRG